MKMEEVWDFINKEYEPGGAHTYNNYNNDGDMMTIIVMTMNSDNADGDNRVATEFGCDNELGEDEEPDYDDSDLAPPNIGALGLSLQSRSKDPKKDLEGAIVGKVQDP